MEGLSGTTFSDQRHDQIEHKAATELKRIGFDKPRKSEDAA
jgi:hypothetical protein